MKSEPELWVIVMPNGKKVRKLFLNPAAAWQHLWVLFPSKNRNALLEEGYRIEQAGGSE